MSGLDLFGTLPRVPLDLRSSTRLFWLSYLDCVGTSLCPLIGECRGDNSAFTGTGSIDNLPPNDRGGRRTARRRQ